jgi:hypothetical protein
VQSNLEKGKGRVETYVALHHAIGQLISRLCEGAEAALQTPLPSLGLGVQVCDLLLHMGARPTRIPLIVSDALLLAAEHGSRSGRCVVVQGGVIKGRSRR